MSDNRTQLLTADETSVIRSMLEREKPEIAAQALNYLTGKDKRIFWKKVIFRALDIVTMAISAYIGMQIGSVA